MSSIRPLTKVMEDRTTIKRRSSFDKMNRICELDRAKAFFRQLKAILAEKRGVNVAPPELVFARRRNRQRRPTQTVEVPLRRFRVDLTR